MKKAGPTRTVSLPKLPFISRELRLTYEAMRRAMQERFLNVHGVTYPQWAYLRVLWDHDGLSQTALSKRVARVDANTVAVVNGLANQGYVKRVPSVTDRRTVNIFLTASGRALKNKLHPKGRSVEEVAMADIAPETVALLRETLRQMRANLGE